MPYFEVASSPALQWVKIPSPSLSSESPYSLIFLQSSISSVWIALASSIRLLPAFAASAILVVAQLKLTAVGLAESSAALAASIWPPLKSASE